MRVLDLQTRIEPFCDLVGTLPLFGTTFDALRATEVEAAKTEARRLTFADYAYAAAPLLSAFVQRAPRGRCSRLALGQGPWSALVPVSSVEKRDGCFGYDIYCDAPQDATLSELRERATWVTVDAPGALRIRELPRLGPPPHQLALPADGLWAAHLEHWVHLLWLPPLMLGRRRGYGNRIAKSAQIHPKAYLENCWIDEDVEIGAKACLINVAVGAGSRISDFTRASHAVLGPKTHTLADACFAELVSLGGGTLASLLAKDTLLGRNVFITTGVIFWTDVLEGTVSVLKNGQEVDTGRKVLGGCAGHGSVLGARTFVAPGRALPNRTTVVMRKEEGVQRIPPHPPGTPLAWNEAALVPVRSFAPDYTPFELD